MARDRGARGRRAAVLAAAAGLTTAVVAGLSGCGTAPWDQPGFNSASATSTSSSTPTPSATITPIINELATGSTQHELKAGDISLTVTYYSTLSMDQWTAAANKPLSFSMTGKLGSDQGQKIYLSRVSVTPAVDGPKGSLPAPAPLTDQASVAPGYLVKDPYSYSQTFVLPALDPAATSMTLSFTYEILLQSAPDSTDYAKQTATDQLTIAIAPPQ